jgi:phosphoribosylglycinamide formyltransferase-1
MKNLVVLISGDGSNLQAVIDACRQGMLSARIAAVFSNRADAYGLQRARQADLPAYALSAKDYADRESFDRALMQRIDAHRPDAVILAGYMRILSPAFVQRYAGKLLNIHPSLLPLYPGLHTHRQVLANGDRIHGTSVHFVTEQLDGGPVILQAKIPVLAGEDEAGLVARIKNQEHAIYPQVIGWLLAGRLALIDKQAWLDGKPLPPSGYAAD